MLRDVCKINNEINVICLDDSLSVSTLKVVTFAYSCRILTILRNKCSGHDMITLVLFDLEIP